MRKFFTRFGSKRGGSALALVVSLALVVALIPGAAFGLEEGPWVVEPDQYEVDDIQATAKAITVGGAPQARTIHSILDRDWVKFTGKAGGYYNISAVSSEMMSVKSRGSAFVYIEVYDAAGQLLKTSFDSEMMMPRDLLSPSDYMVGPSLSPFAMTFRAPSAGTYFLRVASVPYFDEGTGSYTLEVSAVTPSISGTVTDEDGNPVANTWVYAEPYGFDFLSTTSLPFAVAFTDANGEYVLTDLLAGSYLVYFESPDWETYSSEFYDDADEPWDATPVEVAGMSVTPGIDVELDYRDPQISGRVVSETGHPAPDVAVEIFRVDSASSWPYRTDYTDANGEYRFMDLDVGDYKIKFNDYGYNGTQLFVTEWFEDAASATTATVLPVTWESTLSLDATLSMRPVAVSGTVTDEGGEPLPYTWVEIRSMSDQYLGGRYTAADGSWSWSPGYETSMTVKVKAHVDGYQNLMPEYYEDAYTFEDATAVEAGTSTPPHIGMELNEFPPSVSGVVTDAVTGDGIEGIQVWLYREGYESLVPFESTFTDEDGHYEFNAIHQSYVTLRFFDQGGVYAQEFFDDSPTLLGAEVFRVDIGSDVVADEELEAQNGRVYAADRFGTAASIAAENFPDFEDVSTVIIASGDDRAAADPLGASSLCWAYDAPLLLTSARGIPGPSAKALQAIADANEEVDVIVVGGPVSVPAAQLAQLEAMFGAGSVERLPYGDRFVTAREVALRSNEIANLRGEDPGFAMIANGADPAKFFDALSASAVSASTGAPILLSSASTIPSATLGTLGDIGAEDVYLIGGKASVPDMPMAPSISGPSAVRISGPDRYSTSVAVAQAALERNWLSISKIGVAAKVPDALTGGVSIGQQHGPLLITSPTALPMQTFRFIDKYDQMIGQVTVFGGPKSVSGAVTKSIDKALD